MFRVKSYGDRSYYRRTQSLATSAAQDIMAGNGCGCIEERQVSGKWKLVSRFDPYYGIVPV